MYFKSQHSYLTHLQQHTLGNTNLRSPRPFPSELLHLLSRKKSQAHLCQCPPDPLQEASWFQPSKGSVLETRFEPFVSWKPGRTKGAGWTLRLSRQEWYLELSPECRYFASFSLSSILSCGLIWNKTVCQNGQLLCCATDKGKKDISRLSYLS